MEEEFHRRRNSIVISRGDKSKSGNLNINLGENGRINTSEDRDLSESLYEKIWEIWSFTLNKATK